MRFSEFVAYHALQENNRCLHLLSAYPAPLSDNAIHDLRLGVKRLRASWQLLRRQVGDSLFDSAELRLRSIHSALAGPRDELAMRMAVQDLHGKASKHKTQAVFVRVREVLAQPRDAPVTLVSMDHASAGFQQESSVWRDLDVDQLNDGGLIAGYVSSYRHGRRLGRRVLESADDALLHGWRRWVKFSFFQLDMIRPVLGAENRARRWYLDRLGDSLGKHHDLLLLRERLGAVALDEGDCARVAEVLDARLKLFRGRARMLHPYIYTVKGRLFGESIARDVARLTFDHVVASRRSA